MQTHLKKVCLNILDGSNFLNIIFNTDWKKISVSLSGGADSALLAYILCNKIKENNVNIEMHIISHIRCWKTKPWQEWDSLRVYNYLVNAFPNIVFFRHTNFIAPDLEWADKGPTLIDEYGKLVSGDNIQIRSYAEYICKKNNIDIYFNAVTRNPRNVNFKGLPTRDIESNEKNKHLEFMEHMGFLAAHPFRFIEKNQILKKYKELDIMDLFHTTRSCEGVFPEIDYKSYIPNQEVPICGECFWCKERQWSIENA